MIILSILIPTIPERVDMFTALYNKLHRQLEYMQTFHASMGHIEILVNSDKRFLEGGPSIGKKREELVKRAEGKYLCFLDDDEDIADNYLETLVRLCHRDADVVTFRSFAKLKNYWCLIDMGLHYPNDQANPNYTVRRSPWHVCPVRSYFAKLYSFSDINYGEDWLYFEQVLKHCTTEAKTEAIIHSYQHGDHSEADKIVQSEQGTRSNSKVLR
jgi:hypothetical protein